MAIHFRVWDAATGIAKPLCGCYRDHGPSSPNRKKVTCQHCQAFLVNHQQETK